MLGCSAMYSRVRAPPRDSAALSGPVSPRQRQGAHGVQLQPYARHSLQPSPPLPKPFITRTAITHAGAHIAAVAWLMRVRPGYRFRTNLARLAPWHMPPDCLLGERSNATATPAPFAPYADGQADFFLVAVRRPGPPSTSGPAADGLHYPLGAWTCCSPVRLPHLEGGTAPPLRASDQ